MLTRRRSGASRSVPPGRFRPGRTGGVAVRSKMMWLCLAVLFLLMLLAVFAPWLAPYDPFAPDPAHLLQGPSPQHLLGTDELGRDVLSRLMYGVRTALVAALIATGVACAGGVTLGLIAGYVGGTVDRVIMRTVDLVQSIPALLFAIAMVAGLGSGVLTVMLAVGIVFIDSVVRITRARVLAEREMLYVEASVVSGLSSSFVLFRQILPNVAGQIVVFASVLCGVAIIVEGTMSYLGLSSQSGWVSWGGMLSSAGEFAVIQPLAPVFPGLALTSAVLLFNLLGDSVRDRFAGLPSSEGSATGSVDPESGPAEPSSPTIAQESIVAVRAAAVAAAPASARATADRPTRASDISDERTLLRVEGLTVSVAGAEDRQLELVGDVGLDIRRGECFGLIGESGCGKSVTATALLGLLPPGARVTGTAVLGETELLGLNERAMAKVRGRRLSAVFQDPIGSLSPVHTVGRQIVDSIRSVEPLPKAKARARAEELLGLVGVHDPRRRLDDYPFQFSGGMAQRVGIACALAGQPELLIADEPTTGLDVRTQAQVLDLLRSLREELEMAVLLITHDLGVVADSCERVSVMYAGQIVEHGNVEDMLVSPRMPYTRALLDAQPANAAGERRTTLPVIPGHVPPAWDWPAGCRFEARCRYATAECAADEVAMIDGVRCIHPLRANGCVTG